MSRAGKSRWNGPLLTTLTWGFVALNCFPILWMVWCSLMGNNEILQGKTMPDPQRNDVFYVDSLPKTGLLAGTINGELYAYGQGASKNVRYLNLGEVSTSYARQGNNLWALSASGGLQQVDLAHWRIAKTWGWHWIRSQFQQTDKTNFILPPEGFRTQALHQISGQLNNEPWPAGASKSLAEITGLSFPQDQSIVDTLNRLLADSTLRDKSLQALRNKPSWLNPVIPWLFSKERTSRDSRELFRWCLAELFPGDVSRFLQIPWNDVWVNRVPGSGHGTSVSECGDGKICFALWWDEFPGIGVLDPQTNTLGWITARKGLSSSSVQHLLSLNEHLLLAVTDAGLSLIDIQTLSVVSNVLYGECGLKYLDGRDVRVAALDSNKILLAYSQEVMLFDFSTRQGELLPVPMLKGVTSDITALEVDSSFAYLGTSEGVFSVNLEEWLASVQDQENGILHQKHYTHVFESSDGAGIDAVVHDIQSQDGALHFGGLLGLVSSWDVSSQKLLWHAQLPEGRFNLHWRNYEDLWKTIPFGRFLRNSFVICLSVMLISMFVAALSSYALARFQFPGKRLFNGAILATQMVPGILYLIPIFIVFTAVQQYFSIQMVNTWHGIILVYSAFFIPMSIWILRGFFINIPRELEEAALIDGCSPLGAFLRITLPAAFPGIVATGIYVFLLAWDELMFAWVLCTDTSTATIPVGIRLYVGQFGNRFDLLMAAASVATLPVMFLFFLMQRHIVTGLTGGAVKG
ncbi:MAG TPA: carbohydrate ABC transporter permease [Fibrobacteraceae bacterium]|nr:carbohydrate ABC transporter permease [Fibrobacteraceae bacterium]